MKKFEGIRYLSVSIYIPIRSIYGKPLLSTYLDEAGPLASQVHWIGILDGIIKNIFFCHKP